MRKFIIAAALLALPNQAIAADELVYLECDLNSMPINFILNEGERTVWEQNPYSEQTISATFEEDKVSWHDGKNWISRRDLSYHFMLSGSEEHDIPPRETVGQCELIDMNKRAF